MNFVPKPYQDEIEDFKTRMNEGYLPSKHPFEGGRYVEFKEMTEINGVKFDRGKRFKWRHHPHDENRIILYCIDYLEEDLYIDISIELALKLFHERRP